MRIGWVLDYMFGGCSIYRESMPEVKYFAPGGINGAIMVTRTGLTFTMPLDDFGGFRSAEITANDWAYECPGHRWEYSANGEWRGCHICEAEETGDVVREAWRATFKSLPAAGTTHPDPVRCCDDYPACDIHIRMLQPEELLRAMGLNGMKLVGNKSQKVKQIGNAVTGGVGEDLCGTVLDSWDGWEIQEAA